MDDIPSTPHLRIELIAHFFPLFPIPSIFANTTWVINRHQPYQLIPLTSNFLTEPAERPTSSHIPSIGRLPKGTPTITDRVCHICAKGPSGDATLKVCSQCKTRLYCSRECQKADWKDHKKTCGKNASQTANSTASAPSADAEAPNPNRGASSGLSAPIQKPFHQLDSKPWLHNRPEKDVYKLLIDTYRLRCEDQYKFEGEADTDSIYGGAPNSRTGFRRFLRLAERRRGLLPPWWSVQKSKLCLEFSMEDDEYSLECAIEKSDIIETYGDSTMPMQMRLLGEQVYGTGPGGQPGASILGMMKQSESGDGYSSLMDMSGLMGSR